MIVPCSAVIATFAPDWDVPGPRACRGQERVDVGPDPDRPARDPSNPWSVQGDGLVRYGAVRVSHVGQNFLIFDWSYQTDPGNPELLVGGGFFTRARGGAALGPSIR